MRISIVTPTWNRADDLARMFDSVAKQCPPPAEHIVVDNLSSDATESVVQAYASRVSYPVIHRREADCGIYDAMNQGAQIATGDALYFLNDDDSLLAHDSLKTLALGLQNGRADFVFADVLVVDPATGSSKLRSHRQVNRFTMAEKSICQQATLYSRSILEKVGPFDSTLRAAADYDWILKAFIQHAARAAYLRFPVARFSIGGISSSESNRAAFESEMQSVRLRYYDETDLARAKRFRRTWRKFPWGLSLMPDGGSAARLKVTSRIPIAGHLLPNPLACLGF